MLRRCYIARNATKHSIREGERDDIEGQRRGWSMEDTIECWRIRGRDTVRLFLYRDHPRSLSCDGNSDLTRHSVTVDLYRVSFRLHISQQTVMSWYHEL